MLRRAAAYLSQSNLPGKGFSGVVSGTSDLRSTPRQNPVRPAGKRHVRQRCWLPSKNTSVQRSDGAEQSVKARRLVAVRVGGEPLSEFGYQLGR